MDIVRNADGTLVVPVQQEGQHATDAADTSTTGGGDATSPTSQVLTRGKVGTTRRSLSGISNRTPIANPSSRPQPDERRPWRSSMPWRPHPITRSRPR